MRRPLQSSMDAGDYAGDPRIMGRPPYDPEDEEDTPEGLEDPNRQSPSEEEILEAFQDAQELIDEKEREIAELRRLIENRDTDADALIARTDQEMFMEELEDAFRSNPAYATFMLVQRAKEEAVDEMDRRMHSALDDERYAAKFMRYFLSSPENAHMKPYEEELEYLIMERNMSPEEAVNLISALDDKRDLRSSRKDAAQKAVRNRSVLEGGTMEEEPTDKEKELDKVLKKTKTLDEMFAGLSKLKL